MQAEAADHARAADARNWAHTLANDDLDAELGRLRGRSEGLQEVISDLRSRLTAIASSPAPSSAPQARVLKGAVWEAAAAGNVPALQAALDLGGSTEEADDSGLTAVIVAAERGHADVVRVLVGAGARVAARTSVRRGGCVPLAARVVVTSGPGHGVLQSGVPAVSRAAHEGHLDIVVALVAAGADVTAGDNVRREGWDYCGMPSSKFIPVPCVAYAHLQLGMCPLHHAVCSGKPSVVGFFMSHPLVDVNAAASVSRGDARRLCYLAPRTFSDVAKQNGFTALHVASSTGQVRAMDELIAAPLANACARDAVRGGGSVAAL